MSMRGRKFESLWLGFLNRDPLSPLSLSRAFPLALRHRNGPSRRLCFQRRSVPTQDLVVIVLKQMPVEFWSHFLYRKAEPFRRTDKAPHPRERMAQTRAFQAQVDGQDHALRDGRGIVIYGFEQKPPGPSKIEVWDARDQCSPEGDI